jgi:sigma54-dependent transcription regulator
LQAWLGQRGRLFAEIDRTSAALASAERITLDSLIDEILELDATIVAEAEAAMRRVGAEIAAVQKFKKFVAGGVKPAPHSFLRRAL